MRGWNALALGALREAQTASAAPARTLALLHTCMYNAWAAYDDDARQTVHGRAVRLPRAERSAASKAGAMSHAAYIALSDRLPAHRAGFDARMAGLELDPSRVDAQFTPAGIGRTQAIALLDAGRRDDDGLPGEPAPALPFALRTPGQFTPAASLPHGPGERAADTEAELLDHWCRLAQQVSERDGYGDDRDVLLYFVLANALADAAIAAADAGAGRVCAHSALDAAAALVLRSFTGSGQAGAARRLDAAHIAGQELGKKVGARVFEKARRYWQGKL